MKQLLPVPMVGEWLPQQAKDMLGPNAEWIVLSAGAVVVLLLLVLVARALRGGKVSKGGESGLTERLAEYPPPPGPPGPRRLVVEGLPVRLRLVVVAPVGRQTEVDAGEVESLLDNLQRGLGAIVQKDRPRIRVWPPQLSNDGFIVSFQRLTRRPEPEGRPSRWVTVAGQVQASSKKVLLGMAVLADEINSVGHVMLKPHEWAQTLQIRKLEE